MTYSLIDSGGEQKFERWGSYTLVRPCPQAIWRPLHAKQWEAADAVFSREQEDRWRFSRTLPSSWTIELGGVQFKISLTDFGHLGVFPEHSFLWTALRSMIRKEMRVLNLFAYSGGVTMAAAQEGAQVCHLDASKGMVDWARENAALNGLEKAPIRWIVDDAMKFLKREEKRKSFYDAIILDPPTFGRGNQGEVFKIERDIMPLLELCRAVLSNQPRFVILSCHTPLMSPLVLQNLVEQVFGPGQTKSAEMVLSAPNALSIPSGCFAMKTYG
ncbi:MAG: Methyltrans protein [Parachlamydiales bacterium]|nr:Methyltrans protein [Parachlamydiales bacterium]